MTKADLIAYVLARWGDITSPKRVPLKDREVADKLIAEQFPDAVKVEWNGTASVDPTSDIIVYASLPTGKVKFLFRFWKSGNDVHGQVRIENYSAAIFSNTQLISFPTTLYRPINSDTPTVIRGEVFNGNPLTSPFVLSISTGGISLLGNFSPSVNLYAFDFNYKVAN